MALLCCRDEYTFKYVETRVKLQERRTEVMRQIVDHARQEEEVKIKLDEANRLEPRHITEFGIRDDSKLKVHIVDANNLSDDAKTLVVVRQDNSMSETAVRDGDGPIWNEAIVFDIRDPYQQVVL